MAVIALLKIFSSRRWKSAVQANSKVPAGLLSELKKTMSTARDLGLDAPASLQAATSKYCSGSDDS